MEIFLPLKHCKLKSRLQFGPVGLESIICVSSHEWDTVYSGVLILPFEMARNKPFTLENVLEFPSPGRSLGVSGQ